MCKTSVLIDVFCLISGSLSHWHVGAIGSIRVFEDLIASCWFVWQETEPCCRPWVSSDDSWIMVSGVSDRLGFWVHDMLDVGVALGCGCVGSSWVSWCAGDLVA